MCALRLLPPAGEWVRDASTTAAGLVFAFEAALEGTSGWGLQRGCAFSTFLYSGPHSFEIAMTVTADRVESRLVCQRRRERLDETGS
jgi:hypothetical protein